MRRIGPHASGGTGKLRFTDGFIATRYQAIDQPRRSL
jgi:hypothetical protein